MAHVSHADLGTTALVPLLVNILNVQTDKPPVLPKLLAIAKFRRAWLFGTLAFGLTITILLSVLLRPHFRSAGTVLIEQQEMPQEMVRSMITSYADERIQVISKRVMTTETLLGVAMPSIVGV